MDRRDFLKLGVVAGAGTLLTSYGIKPAQAQVSDMPTSPLVLEPFSDPLPIPQPLAQSDPRTWIGDPVDRNAHQIWMKPKEYYNIKLQVAPHSFSSSRVRLANGTEMSSLPDSTIYGFNGTFPGPMIRATYGRPALVRFENHLDENPFGLDRGDFGVPEFLTHLHNGHSAPESDGNPFHHPHAFMPGEAHDNLYLNWPAGGDPREKQSFMWFHDHTHGETGANVSKGMVGLYPIYDPGVDSGDETMGLRLPGFEHDIPMAFYDCRLDDGVTRHDGIGQDGLPHPENLGKLFYGHYPNHGFVGDIFTVNGVAQPFMVVERRKYRFRFLDASVARWYDLKLMTGAPQLAPDKDGQWALGGASQCMRFTQVATSSLLPAPRVRDTIRIIPAWRREVVVDFAQYMDGSPTQAGDVVYLCNTLEMTDGRKPDGPGVPVPMLKIIIGNDPAVPDLSVIPPVMRPLPPIPPPTELAGLRHRNFKLDRSGSEWTINGLPFDPHMSIANPRKNSTEVWILENGGGGWAHPMHIHQEQHQLITRNGAPPSADDFGEDDTVDLMDGDEVAVYRKFRTFTGKYVAHCHNLAHEDHAMMFAWTITP